MFASAMWRRIERVPGVSVQRTGAESCWQVGAGSKVLDLPPRCLHGEVATAVQAGHQGRLMLPCMSGSDRTELHVEFTKLGLRLKSTGKRVLAGVTGCLRAACLTAIMGPSGAGDDSPS